MPRIEPGGAAHAARRFHVNPAFRLNGISAVANLAAVSPGAPFDLA
jgi:hypothetical protein